MPKLVKAWVDHEDAAVTAIRVYYADGTIVEGPPDAQTWESGAADGVQVVLLFYDRCYVTWIRDDQDRRVQVSRSYTEVISGADWYWFDPADDSFGTAAALIEVPTGASAKAGTTSEDFFGIYNRALIAAGG